MAMSRIITASKFPADWLADAVAAGCWVMVTLKPAAEAALRICTATSSRSGTALLIRMEQSTELWPAWLSSALALSGL